MVKDVYVDHFKGTMGYDVTLGYRNMWFAAKSACLLHWDGGSHMAGSHL